MEARKLVLMDALCQERDNFDRRIENLEKQVDEFKTLDDASQFYSISEDAYELQASLESAVNKSEDVRRREALFGWTPTEYTHLQAIGNTLKPYYTLWTMYADFVMCKEECLNGAFLDIDAEDVQTKIESWWKLSYRMSKSLKPKEGEQVGANGGPAAVALKLRELTDEFKVNVPIIQALGSKAIQKRHWEKISDRLGDNIVPDKMLTLQKLINLGMGKKLEAVLEITAVAEKEFGLEKALKAMEDEWNGMSFECLSYRETGTFVIKGTDDILGLLDDHIVKIQTLLGSPYVRGIIKLARSWEKKLQYTQAVIDEWLKVQRTWMYLEPIFGSDDIMRQMPKEGRRFASVDSMWRTVMTDVQYDPGVMTVCGDEKLHGKFKKANELLDVITKGLNDYLEIKRMAFARFFFLSNDELLEILSQTKDPAAVQPFLGKCLKASAESYLGAILPKIRVIKMICAS